MFAQGKLLFLLLECNIQQRITGNMNILYLNQLIFNQRRPVAYPKTPGGGGEALAPPPWYATASA